VFQNKNIALSRCSSVLILLLTLAACEKTADPAKSQSPPTILKTAPSRIVSLSPSLTEILFELGLDKEIVGVTRYCQYPPQARKKKQVGGYYDPNYEALIGLNPDLVLTLPEHDKVRARLDQLKLRHATVSNRSIKNILQSIQQLGDLCHVPVKAKALRSRIETEMKSIQARARSEKKARVLITISRESNTATVEGVTACGRGSLFEELILLAGGLNAYQGKLPYPKLSGEGVLAMAPDVIVELHPEKDSVLKLADVKRDWAPLSSLPAVKTGKISVIQGNHALIPGPRFILTLKQIARAIHPDKFQGS
jgi:iron complex transport system substrate-binding protein